jgi:L,D-transpeptidase catalytic domain
MHIFSLILLLNFLLPAFPCQVKAGADSAEIHRLWTDCRLEGVMQFKVFNMALSGYKKIENLKKKNIITIIDFSLPSTEKRLFVIDLENKKILFNCLVAHGKNSGENYATSFSNDAQSLKSSLGFFITSETYTGKNGYSLRLDGLEKNINDNARTREIVIHGADYVSEKFIKQYGRLGRSWGCPSVPPDILNELVDKISNGSCLFIYADDKYYRENSVFISGNAER